MVVRLHLEHTIKVPQFFPPAIHVNALEQGRHVLCQAQ